jgi:ATPase family associated with various cellular activities (AAA)
MELVNTNKVIGSADTISTDSVLKANAEVLHMEMQWLAMVIDTRMKLYWGQDCGYASVSEVQAPRLEGNGSFYAQFIGQYGLSMEERLILLLALAPHIQPTLLDVFFVKNAAYDRGFTEFGGIKGQQYGGFIPTGETAAFVLSANDIENRLILLTLFGEDHFFRQCNILRLSSPPKEEPVLSGVLHLSPEYLSLITKGATHKPEFGIHFPAKRIQTALHWGDLVLEENTLDEVLEIRDWLEFGDTLLNDWNMRDKIRPGFRALLYGPPGTGKTLTATLLGQSAELDVYRIDLSMVVSKYIGETEKNLANVFDQAEHKHWILFFDEADALFSKRTATASSNDRYANQEVSYLLQRIEDFPGVVILSTNLRANLDEAFSRRFQSMIYFPTPGPEQRLKLWQQSFSDKTVMEEAVNLPDIAGKYELTGGAIINITRYCSLKALKRGNNSILRNDILTGIRKEFRKEGKTIT